MDNSRITPRAQSGTGAVTTFYSYQNGQSRSLALANMAWLLAGRQHATVPVLMIDWDLESPGLHYQFGAGADRPGLLELLEACRDRHAALLQCAAADAANTPADPTTSRAGSSLPSTGNGMSNASTRDVPCTCCAPAGSTPRTVNGPHGSTGMRCTKPARRCCASCASR